MASIVNRSRYIVSVKNSPTLTKEFSFKRKKEAKAYLGELKGEGFASAKLARLDNCFLVRFRERDLEEFGRHVHSREEARELIAFVTAQNTQEIPPEYLLGDVTFAQLADVYIENICPTHKGGKVEAYTLSSMLRDAGYVSKLEARLQQSRSAKKAASEEAKRLEAARPKNKNMARAKKKKEPEASLEKKESRKRGHVMWMNKPMKLLTSKDIQRFVNANCGVLNTDELDTSKETATIVSRATVDRELDLISQVIRWAINKEGVKRHNNPMSGITRPIFNNERDVRLLDGEEEQLLLAAREEDRIQSRNRAIQQLLEPVRLKAAALGASESTRKRFIAAGRREIEDNLHTFEIAPIYETLITFLLATAARRSEALGLLWEYANLIKGTAFFPETKNGTARTVPLRSHLVDLLKELESKRDPSDPRVFPITGDSWDGAWDRIRARAGLDEDFRRHDLRHEAISQIAEAGHQSGMPFDVVTLASITGHRDLRSLQRYINLDKGRLAKHMDHVFAEARRREMTHKGRVRLPTTIERQLMQQADALGVNHDTTQDVDASITISQRVAI